VLWLWVIVKQSQQFFNLEYWKGFYNKIYDSNFFSFAIGDCISHSFNVDFCWCCMLEKTISIKNYSQASWPPCQTLCPLGNNLLFGRHFSIQNYPICNALSLNFLNSWLYPTIKLGCLFCFVCLFVLFVTFISLGPCVPRLRAWYRWKALCKEGCTNFVSWHLDL